MATLAPAPANARATPRPMPREPPVTSAKRPYSRPPLSLAAAMSFSYAIGRSRTSRRPIGQSGGRIGRAIQRACSGIALHAADEPVRVDEDRTAQRGLGGARIPLAQGLEIAAERRHLGPLARRYGRRAGRTEQAPALELSING